MWSPRSLYMEFTVMPSFISFVRRRRFTMWKWRALYSSMFTLLTRADRTDWGNHTIGQTSLTFYSSLLIVFNCFPFKPRFHSQGQSSPRLHRSEQTGWRSLGLQFPLSAWMCQRTAVCLWPLQAPASHTRGRWAPLEGSRGSVQARKHEATLQDLCTGRLWSAPPTCRASFHTLQLHVPRTALIHGRPVQKNTDIYVL